MAAYRSPRDDALSGLRAYIATNEATVDFLEDKAHDYEAAEHMRESIQELRRALTWLETHPKEEPLRVISGEAISKSDGYYLQNAVITRDDEAAWMAKASK